MTEFKLFRQIFTFQRVTSSTTYVPQIDGLRFLALLPVLLWHSGLRGLRFFGAERNIAVKDSDVGLPHGHIGVYLFFFISGYIIAYPFFKKGMQDIGTFYLRRLSRLHPPYIIALIFCFFALMFAGRHLTNAPSFAQRNDVSLIKSLAASLFYMHGLLFNSPPRLDPPAWSLEIEIQFYLIAPMIFWLISKIKTNVFPTLLAVTVLLAIISAGLNLAYGEYGWHNRTVVGYLYIFLLGVAFSLYAVNNNPFAKTANFVFDIGFLLGLALWIYTGYAEQGPLDASHYIALYIFQVIAIPLIYFGAARGQIFRKIMALPLICSIGGMCFSIYLVHVPLMQITAELLMRHLPVNSFPLAICLSLSILIPLSLATGLVFFVLFERPCMDPRWPHKLHAFMSAGKRRSSDPPKDV